MSERVSALAVGLVRVEDGAGAQQCLCGIKTTTVAGGHQRGVTLRAAIGRAEDKIDVCAFFDFFVDETDVVLRRKFERGSVPHRRVTDDRESSKRRERCVSPWETRDVRCACPWETGESGSNRN